MRTGARKAEDNISVLIGENILCFGVTDYGHDIPVGKDHLMETFCKAGNRILMVNLVGLRKPEVTKYDIAKVFRKVKEWCRGCRIINGIYVINPFRIPMVNYELINRVNQHILGVYLRYYCRKLGIRDSILWALNVLYSDLYAKLKRKALVYYVSDDLSLFTGNTSEALSRYETKLLSMADGVVTVSKKLYDDKRSFNKNTMMIYNATNPLHFIEFKNSHTPRDLGNVRRPIVGFSGKIEDWVDLDLIKTCATKYPDYSFVLVGPAKTSTAIIKECPNIYVLGQKSYEELPGYLSNFDIAILPFRKTERMKTVDIPLTLQEYLAVGKPVVAININQVEEYKKTYTLVKTRDEFIREVGCALEKDERPIQERRRRIALENSWEKRADQLSNWMQKTIFSNCVRGSPRSPW